MKAGLYVERTNSEIPWKEQIFFSSHKMKASLLPVPGNVASLRLPPPFHVISIQPSISLTIKAFVNEGTSIISIQGITLVKYPHPLVTSHVSSLPLLLLILLFSCIGFILLNSFSSWLSGTYPLLLLLYYLALKSWLGNADVECRGLPDVFPGFLGTIFLLGASAENFVSEAVVVLVVLDLWMPLKLVVPTCIWISLAAIVAVLGSLASSEAEMSTFPPVGKKLMLFAERSPW